MIRELLLWLASLFPDSRAESDNEESPFFESGDLVCGMVAVAFFGFLATLIALAAAQ